MATVLVKRSIAPYMGIWIPESGNIGFGIRKTAQRILNPTDDWNPESQFHRQKRQNSVAGIQSPWHGIQKTGLSWIPLHGAKKICIHLHKLVIKLKGKN